MKRIESSLKIFIFLNLLILSQLSLAARTRYLYDCAKIYDINESERVLKDKLKKIAYPEVPDLDEVNLVTITHPDSLPQKIVPKTSLSPGVSDPLLARARELVVVDDFKPLSDLKRLPLSTKEYDVLTKKASQYADSKVKSLPVSQKKIAHEKEYIKFMLKNGYDDSSDLIVVKGSAKPLWKIQSGDSTVDDAFNYTEEYLQRIIRKTPAESKGSMLSVPYEVTVPNDYRFDEFYYWDTYFGAQGLIETGRLELAEKQVEVFLSLIRKYGLIPNGNRDYYLGRSQPPFVASMIFDVYNALKKKHANDPKVLSELKNWLEKRAFPLLERDLNNFWMNPEGRFDQASGLHHHWDDLDLKRPERSAHDVEVMRFENDPDALGVTPRDARATAESGLDFSAELDQRGSRVANVLLNSVLYQYMEHMSVFAKEIGASKSVITKYANMAKNKKQAIDKFLWNEQKGVYQNYNLEKQGQVPVVSASTFVPLYVGAASKSQAQKVAKATLNGASQETLLELPYGIKASTAKTHHQWDDVNLWAPYQYMAWEGLSRYGKSAEAIRLADKYVKVVSKVHAKHGVFMERYDGLNGTRPAEVGDKYTTQEGFLWTNSAFVVALRRYLKVPLVAR